MKYCESCGNQLKDNATYCPKCGTHVGENKDNSEVEKRNKSFNDKKLSKGQKIALVVAALSALTGFFTGMGQGMWLTVIVSFFAMAAVIAVFVGAIDKKHAWITAVCAFFAVALAAGASAPDEEKGEQPQVHEQTQVREQMEQKQETDTERKAREEREKDNKRQEILDYGREWAVKFSKTQSASSYSSNFCSEKCKEIFMHKIPNPSTDEDFALYEEFKRVWNEEWDKVQETKRRMDRM
jgi:hypothetical protein